MAASPTSGGHPGTSIETLRRAFAAVLRVDRVGADDSFFDLGGHSLLAMELLLGLERDLGVEVTVSSFYDHPSPAALARLVDQLVGSTRQNRFLIPIQPEGTRPPIYAVHVLGVNSAYFRPLAAMLGDDQPLFGLGQPTLDLDTTIPTAVEGVAALYLDELVRRTPEGPVVLAAVSLGAVVAWELAHQLRARGREVALLALFDAAGPAAPESAIDRSERLGIHARMLATSPVSYAATTAGKLRERAARQREIVAGRLRASFGADLADQQRIRRFIEDNWRAQIGYQHRPFDRPVVVFKAGDDPFNARLAADGMGWQHIVDGDLDVVTTPGGHLSMLAEPHVGALAAHLDDAITDALSDRRHDGLGPGTPTDPGQPTPAPPAQGPQLAAIHAAGVEATMVEALHRGHLGVTVARLLAPEQPLTPAASRLVAQVDTTMRGLSAQAQARGEQAAAALESIGIEAVAIPLPDRLQHLTAGVRLPTAGKDEVTAAVDALRPLGYRLQDPLSAGAWQAFLRTATACTLIGTDESTSRIDLSWGDPTEGQPAGRRPWRPTRADLTAIDLPAAAWPLYAALRPFRLVGDRLRGRTGGGDLGVFLGTPTTLVGDILAIAAPTNDDVLVDIGCGDGRVLIEAAARFGCRAVGVENDEHLVALAKENAAAAGLGSRISIIAADAASPEGSRAIDTATVAFLFLPAEISAALLPDVLDRLPPGARVVAHEQTAGEWPVEPDLSRLVIGSGLTVAHRWTVT